VLELFPLPLKGAFEIRGKTLNDERGWFRKTLEKDFFEKNGLAWRFAEQYYTSSKKGVIRGMHFQVPPYDHEKLVYCARGSATDVVVDLRKNSPTFKQFATVTLNEKAHNMVYIPRGFAHGFVSHADDTMLVYGVTSVHEQSADTGIRWDSFGYDWGLSDPILSSRDRGLPALENFNSPF
jgi:dTDP-4-dehydrorhamnose 3,5-epimerase